jgi:large conductance mechanosensitive channel
MWKEFKEFALRGNMLDLAVGIIIGAAFTTVVQSLVDDIIMPPIGMLTGGLDFSNLMLVLSQGNPPGPYATPAAAAEAGAVAITYGQFINNIIYFLIVALAVFLLIRAINRMTVQKKDEPAEGEPVMKECPYCVQEIPINATRCPFCTSQLEGTPRPVKLPSS